MSAERGFFHRLSVVCAWIIGIAVLPIISVLCTYTLSSALGCGVNEGGATPCPFMGVDLGETLLTTMMFGWLGLISVPLGGVAVAVWLVAWIAHRWQRQHQT